MASNDSLSAQGSDWSTRIWPIAIVGWLIAFSLVIFYGSQAYIGWRYNARVELGLLDLGVWIELLKRLPPLFRAELAFVGFGAFGVALAFLRPLLAGWKRSRQKPHGIEDLHGTARWATREEIQIARLLPRKGSFLKSFVPSKRFLGVVIGGWQESPGKPVHFLKDDSKNHVLVFAPTRSGKGVSIVLPTLLDSLRESALVYDPKGEEW